MQINYSNKAINEIQFQKPESDHNIRDADWFNFLNGL